MYVRFQSQIWDGDARCFAGIFRASGDVRYARPDLENCWQFDEIETLAHWFNRHLDVPNRFWYRPNQRAELSGVCWFRDSATECISRAHYLAWLLTDLGYAIQTIRSRFPGRVLWQDAHQVVASRHLL